MENQQLIQWSERDKIRLAILIAAALLLFVLSGTAWSIDYGVPGGAIGSPTMPPTMPPTSIQSGLIRSPNPVDTSGNLVITGNVGRGRHFRGPVLYESTNAFRAPLGSSSVESFLRDSAGADSFDRYISGYTPQPYYSPTQTVTAMTPGRSDVFSPSSSRISDRVPGQENLLKKETLPRPLGVEPSLSRQDTSFADVRSRSLLSTPQQMNKLLSEQGTTMPRSERLGTEQYQLQMEQLRQDLQQLTEKMSQLKQKMAQSEESVQMRKQVEPAETVRQPFEEPALESPIQPTQKPSGQKPAKSGAIPAESPAAVGQLQESRTGDVYERIKQQLAKLKASEQKEKLSGITEKPSLSGEQWVRGSEAAKSYLDELTGSKSEQRPTKEISGAEEVKQLSQSELAAEAKRIMGPHQTLESFSQARFNQAIDAAKEYLKQGRYYRAADSYAMASIYKRDDPAATAGRAYALFAAGEYVSSALFLARVIELSPDYAQKKVDIAELLADKDTFNSRMAELEQWLERTGVAELRFLLAYLHYCTGNIERAKFMIDIAADKMPQAPSVKTLKKVIDNAAKTPKTR